MDEFMVYVLLVLIGSVVLRVLFPPQPSTHVVYMPMMPVEQNNSGGGLGVLLVIVLVILLFAFPQ
jgi:hypothetical protein